MKSTVDRIDYSNDTATASPKGPLSSARYNLAATGNISFGYFGGGIVSTVDRIDYSNDTATASPKGPLSLARISLAAAAPEANGIANPVSASAPAPAPSGPQLITNGLQLNLDAGDSSSYSGSGSTWYDLSGNGRNFTWYSTPSYTSGSIPYFSTLGNRCTGPASNSFGINNTSGYTIFLICRQNSLAQSSAFKFYKNNLSSFSGRGIFAHCTWSNDYVFLDQGGCCNTDTRTSVASGGSQTWNIWTFRRFTNSSTRTISKNGSTLVTNTASAATIDLDSRSVDLGSTDENGGNSSTWNARLGGFIVYNRGLSDSEITDNYNVLKSKYGL